MGRDALRRHQGFGLRLRRRQRGAGGLPEHQGGIDPALKPHAPTSSSSSPTTWAIADLGCYGGRDAAFGPVSPVLDALAAGGLRFTQGYANSPVCSPTRFALMTGALPVPAARRGRGADQQQSRGSTTLGLPPEHPTLPSLLRDAGYRTALIGKWHLGYPPHFGPLRSGYDEFFGPMSRRRRLLHPLRLARRARPVRRRGRAADERLPDRPDHRSARCDYVRAHGRAGGAPFFLSLHYTAPHWPWETRDDARAGRTS